MKIKVCKKQIFVLSWDLFSKVLLDPDPPLLLIRILGNDTDPQHW